VREARAEDRLELALIENVQRENLTPLEEAEAYRLLIDERGFTQDEIAERVGKSRPAVTNTLRLLGLPDTVKAQLENGELTAGHARAVLAIEGVPEQVTFAREIVSRRLTKSQAEHVASARRTRPDGGHRGSQASARLRRSLASRYRMNSLPALLFVQTPPGGEPYPDA
jgi:ParB family chromosome partitioning protein